MKQTTSVRSALPLLLGPASASVLVLTTAAAHAGPTVSADLDLGTSVTSTPSGPTATATGPAPSPLYLAGFAIRAGWRFDVAPVWFLPEIGFGYAVQRFDQAATTASADDRIGRVFGGGRIGWSGAMRPGLRFEPAIFGHAGFGWYDSTRNGSAFDVGVSLDLRIREHFIAGAQVGYSVVTVWSTPSDPCAVAGAGTVCLGSPSSSPRADPWIGYGAHAGYLFW